jgi:hypothetical protein
MEIEWMLMRFFVFSLTFVGAAAVFGQAPPIPPVQSVTPMGIVTQDPLVQGRDGTYSAQIGSKSIWLFNDTALTKNNASGTNYVDSLGDPTQFFPFLPWEAAYNAAHSSNNCTADPCGANIAIWPGPLVPDPARNRALIFYGEIWRSPTYSGWIDMGEGVAVMNADGTITRPVMQPGTPYPTLMWQGTEVGFTSGWVVSGDTLYTYGNQAEFLSENTQIARVPLADSTTASAWTYYAGNGTWSSSASNAVTVFNGGAAGSSVFYDNYLGEYVGIYSGVENNNCYYIVGTNPWGPWSTATQFYTGLAGESGSVDYALLAHPEFAEGNGQTEYVTYVQTTGFLAQQIQLVQLVFGPEPKSK